MASRWTIKCSKPGCEFKREKIESVADAKRHAKSHNEWPGHKVDLEEIKPLSKAFRVGDRIKLKEDRAKAVADDASRMGWDINREEIRLITRIDHFGPGGSDRLFVEGPPFAFNPRDVALAWNSDDERRAGLGL